MDTYLACSIPAEGASNMLDKFVPDYLIVIGPVRLGGLIVDTN